MFIKCGKYKTAFSLIYRNNPIKLYQKRDNSY